MNKLISTILLMILAVTINAQTKTSEGLISESESKYTFTQTVDTLTKVAGKNKWKVIIVHDLQASLKKNGKEVLPVKVIEVCNPNYSFNVLNKEEFKLFSSMMPCRISVYEKADGKTYVSRINTGFMNEVMKDKQCKSMSNALSDIEKFISNVVK
ncbi:DUF302 domain-containing protein [Stygiobacter electus]|uniref:DUF302 domain-containing protein n=1 Tax=Stygiobacter electus TaxID=3032292 RepID=A0AAE3TFC6_9BACT|nr:DUF302 domain-containing protein [Stygiobacter electus]MDF1613293.1 DUF302 domain-containing protein [Stygiobacter electus]